MSDFKPIPQDEMDEMKAREDTATEGPWEARHLAVYDDPLIIEGGEGRTAEMHGMPAQVLRIWRDEQNRRCTQFLVDVHQTRGRRDRQSDDDADFIARARTDQTYLRNGYQALLAEYEKQREVLDKSLILGTDIESPLIMHKSVGITENMFREGIKEHNARIDEVLGREGH